MEDEMEIVDEMGKEVVVRNAPWWKSTIFISEIRFLAKFLSEVEIGDGDTKKWGRNRTIFFAAGARADQDQVWLMMGNLVPVVIFVLSFTLLRKIVLEWYGNSLVNLF